MIPYGKQEVTQEDIDAVVSTLKSDFLTQGNQVPDFESSICKYVGSSFAVASNSATSSLHIACLSLGLKKGDSVWTSPITFVASANCALYCGAKIDFVDIDQKTYNMSASALETKLIQADKDNQLPKIVIPVHLAGQSSEMKKIYALSQRYDFKIIEDASHAIGGEYLNQKIGNCKYSDITIFSFHPVKIITSGEGGVATTNNEYLASKMSELRSHGITRNLGSMKGESHGPWFYQQINLGFNYRMTDIHAALGKSQLKRVDSYISKRHEIAQTYNNELANLPITLPQQRKESFSSFHLYIIRLKLNEISNSHLSVFSKLRDEGIGVNLHYIPVYLHPFYAKFNYLSNHFPEAERYYQEAISIPIFPTMSDSNISDVIRSLKNSLN